MSFRPKTVDIFTREKDYRCYGYIITGAFRSETEMAWECVVSFAAVIRVVTERSSPVSGEERCVTTLITAAKETRECVDVYIIKRTLHGHLKIRNFSSRAEKYITRSLRSLVVREIFFNTRRESSYLLAAM